MAITFPCGKCGNELAAEYIGDTVTCAHCGEATAAPMPATRPAPPPPPPAPPEAPVPAAAPTPPPTAPAAPPPQTGSGSGGRRGLGMACCCGCGALAGLLVLLLAVIGVLAIPRIKATAYLNKAVAAEMPALQAMATYNDNPAWKTVKTHDFSPDNMGEARDALESLAKSSADVRHAIDEAQKQLGGLTPPADLADLQKQMSELNDLVGDGLNGMEPQIDYLAFIVKSLGSAAKSFRELEGSSVGGLDSAADLLTKCRAAVKAIHDEIMVKSAPPGCEKLHTDTIRSLEAMSSACADMASAIRARDYRQMMSLAKRFESSMTSAAERFESAYSAWGSQSDKRTEQFGKDVKAKAEALVKRLEEAQAKYGLPQSTTPAPSGGAGTGKPN